VQKLRKLAAVSVATAALATPLALHAPANAAAVPAPSPSTAAAKPAGGASAAAVIRCQIRTFNPHYSHHAHAQTKHRVNVTAKIQCTSRVAGLQIKVRLLKNGRAYKTTGWKRNAGKAYISFNAARRCVKNQRYQGEAWGIVAFPPRYVPPVARIYDKSPVVIIRRCAR
jgi:hypothetical protein